MKKKKKEIKNLTLFNLKILLPFVIILIFTAILYFGKHWDLFSGERFSVGYPNSWKAEKTTEPLAKGVFLKGSEGSVQILVGKGFGGGCDPKSLKRVKLGKSDVAACSSVDNNGLEVWGILSPLNGAAVSVIAHVNPPYNQNRKTIFNVFSSFKPL